MLSLSSCDTTWLHLNKIQGELTATSTGDVISKSAVTSSMACVWLYNLLKKSSSRIDGGNVLEVD